MASFIEANLLTLGGVLAGFVLGIIFAVKNPNRKSVRMFAEHMKD